MAEVRRRWSALASAHPAGVEATDYFDWRDAADRDSNQVDWERIAKSKVLAALVKSGAGYAERSLDRLEAGDREVVRVGLHLGIRWRADGHDQNGGGNEGR